MALLHPWLRLVLSGLVGAVLGVVVGWCTNGAMVEISINAIFATYFGCFFLFLAGIITWRVLEFSATANRKSLLVLSCMMGLSGLICIFYQRHWFFVLGAAYRIPIYTLIGTSVSFALSFSIAELLNFAWTAPWSKVVAPRAQSALVQTPHQVLLLAGGSVTLGCLYGLIFGVSEVGKGVFTMHTLRVQFLHEERICIPLGAAIGAITGILNERWRPAPGSGGRPPETDSDTPGGWGGGGRSVFGFGDERPAAAAGSGTPGGGSGVGGGWLGTSNSGGVFGSTPRGGGPDAGSGSNSPAGAAFREEKGAALGGGAAALPSVTLGDSAPLHPAALGRRLVAGGGGAAAAAGADDFDPFQSAHH